ncbi:MAG: hypothetical protein ACOH2E_01700 [Candidatus Paracaedibacter sp.]
MHEDIKGETGTNATNPVKKNSATQGTGFNGNCEETFSLKDGGYITHSPNAVLWRPRSNVTISGKPGTKTHINGLDYIMPNVQPNMTREDFVVALIGAGLIDKGTSIQRPVEFQGNWEETFKLNNGASVTHTSKDIIWKPVPFMTATNPSPGTSMNVNGKQIIFPNLQPYMSREEFVAVLKATGHYDGS